MTRDGLCIFRHRSEKVPVVAIVVLVWISVACSGRESNLPEAPKSPTPAAIPLPYALHEIAQGLEHPWSLAFLPDGRMLVTERPGRMRIVSVDGAVSPPLGNVPAVFADGQGGLLDVILDPAFANNELIYFSFAEQDDPGRAGTAVGKAKLLGTQLSEVQVIYRQAPKVAGNAHYGSRLVFGRDGALFVTQGDRYDHAKRAQSLSSGIGKIVRVRTDGSIPEDNPFAGRMRAKPEIWSIGHRNVQAAALHPETGVLWTVEHGARGGDELNRPQAGKNYGWPEITYGMDYSGAKIGTGTTREGMEQPVYYWDPVIAPSGMLFYTGTALPEWTGSVFVGSLNPGGLVRLTLNGDAVAVEERFLKDLGERVRDVRQGPDGFIYLLTDSPEGRILRIEPQGGPQSVKPQNPESNENGGAVLR